MNNNNINKGPMNNQHHNNMKQPGFSTPNTKNINDNQINSNNITKNTRTQTRSKSPNFLSPPSSLPNILKVSQPPQLKDDLEEDQKQEFKDFIDIFSHPPGKQNPLMFILKYLKIDEIMKLSQLNKSVGFNIKHIPLLENIVVEQNMVCLNKNTWQKFHILSEKDSLWKLLKTLSPNGLKHVKLQCADDSDDFSIDFGCLKTYLQKADRLESITIEGSSNQSQLNHDSEERVQKLCSSVKVEKLIIDNTPFKLSMRFLHNLKNIKELIVLSNKCDWDLSKFDALPSSLKGLTFCPPKEPSLLAVTEKLPMELQRIYLKNTLESAEKLHHFKEVEFRSVFKKFRHVELDYSLLTSFTKPEEDITTT
eukprot:UN30900